MKKANILLLLLSMISIGLIGYGSAYENVFNKVESNIYRTGTDIGNRCIRKEYSRDTGVLGIGFLRSNQKSGEGLTIDSIIPNSPAEKEGLKVGDKIIEINGISMINSLSGHDKVKDFTNNYKDSTGVSLSYISGGIKKIGLLNKVTIINKMFVCQKYELNQEDVTIASNISEKIKGNNEIRENLQKIRFQQTSPRIVSIIREILVKLSQ